MREAFKQFLIIIFLIALLVVTFSALAVAEGKSPGLNSEWRVAIASWYGEPFFGNRTANGEFFTPYVISVAHRTLPFNTIVEICYPVRDKCIYTRVSKLPLPYGRGFKKQGATKSMYLFGTVYDRPQLSNILGCIYICDRNIATV